MMLDHAIRLTEILLAIAFIQQSTEHLYAPKNERILFLPRLILSILLLFGFATSWISFALFLMAFLILIRFQGPYNGGSDRMGLLILCCLCLVHAIPSLQWQEYVFGYLALQVTLSYFMSGWVKIVNSEWRSGRALQDVFLFSVYPASESFRRLASRPKLLWLASWGVMLFELLFPFTLLSQKLLAVGLVIAATFHLANACLFGLNRFLWIWIAAYPSLFWLQERIFG